MGDWSLRWKYVLETQRRYQAEAALMKEIMSQTQGEGNKGDTSEC